MKVAVVGATGLVGTEMLRVLEERKFPVDILLPVATTKSIGKELVFKGQEVLVVGIEEALSQYPDIALFSAGGATSKKWAPEFAKVGCTVIDNSSAWRMDPHVPLIVPEVNAHVLTMDHKIISNPNCSTIQLVVAIAPLHREYKINRMVISTYQSVTGSGMPGVMQLENERKGKKGEMAYPHPIDLNIIPHGGDFLDNGYTTEEMKLVDESRKILGDQSIGITATVVRVPVFGGHSESVNLTFEKDFELETVLSILSNAPGVTVLDNIRKNEYPMPLFAKGRDEVFVGRIRRDHSQPNSLNLWIVSDNLRKGAATNAVQIGEVVVKLK
ncbi:MAG: aspartate-semialdehyde dehydrogenase [Bacteroidales bacterium]|nr:aspartate-semialdehyde dehydrogenase [Bacteroidales bacterium]MCF8458965.1 aspartate-semialdehyde dehydrogenase [Bacteroidales bacterium]